MKPTELTTVPTFIYEQGEFGDDNFEFPIIVKYWNKGEVIELNQQGNGVLIRAEDIMRLAKEIKRHLPEAIKQLSK